MKITIRIVLSILLMGFMFSVKAQTCQTYMITLQSTSPIATIDSGIYYIDICPGDTVHLCAIGLYFQNDISYHQSDTTTKFYWSFGNGMIDSGKCVSTVYDSFAGYNINLTTYDINGCVSMNYIEIRVRVSTDIFTSVGSINPICIGDSIALSLGKLQGNNFVVEKKKFTLTSTLSVADTVYLPDGTGVSYMSSVNFTSFPAGLNLMNINDLIAVYATIEHSYLGDLNIALTCPNNQTTTLKSYPGGGSIYLGEAYDNNATPIPGVGYTYRWTPTALAGNVMGSMAGTSYNYTNVAYQNLTHNIMPPSTGYPASGNALLPGGITGPIKTYSPATSFNNLLGCPLNGLWTITVTDNLGIDNGYIFDWSLELNANLLPHWDYEVDIDSIAWNGPGIVQVNDSVVYAVPTTSGVHTYSVTAYDNLGCSWTETIDALVYSLPNANLLPDTAICGGDSILLDPNAPALSNVQWSSGQTASTIYTSQSGSYSCVVTDTANCVNSDSVEIEFIEIPFFTLGADSTVCESESITFTAFNPISTSVLWSTGDVTTDITVNTSATYIATLFNGICKFSDTVEAEFMPFPSIGYLPSDTNFCEGSAILLSFPANPTYNYFVNGTPSANSIMISDSGTFNIWVHNNYCEIFDTIHAEAIDCHINIYIPNAFTPNGDGTNDVFLVLSEDELRDFHMEIYNRWGKQVFVSDNIFNGWDGRISNEKCPPGTYVWRIVFSQFDGGISSFSTFEKHGSIILIR